MARQERKKAYAREYWREHYKKECKRVPRDKPYVPPSTEAIEEQLPYGMKKNRLRLRAEYLEIPIHKRPPYDYYLRCRTVGYYRKMRYEREHATTSRRSGRETIA